MLTVNKDIWIGLSDIVSNHISYCNIPYISTVFLLHILLVSWCDYAVFFLDHPWNITLEQWTRSTFLHKLGVRRTCSSVRLSSYLFLKYRTHSRNKLSWLLQWSFSDNSNPLILGKLQRKLEVPIAYFIFLYVAELPNLLDATPVYCSALLNICQWEIYWYERVWTQVQGNFFTLDTRSQSEVTLLSRLFYIHVPAQ